jgi:hypothetical protein
MWWTAPRLLPDGDKVSLAGPRFPTFEGEQKVNKPEKRAGQEVNKGLNTAKKKDITERLIKGGWQGC